MGLCQDLGYCVILLNTCSWNMCCTDVALWTHGSFFVTSTQYKVRFYMLNIYFFKIPYNWQTFMSALYCFHGEITKGTSILFFNSGLSTHHIFFCLCFANMEFLTQYPIHAISWVTKLFLFIEWNRHIFFFWLWMGWEHAFRFDCQDVCYLSFSVLHSFSSQFVSPFDVFLDLML